jgi:NTE family protein
MKHKKIKNLALKGGGVKGIAYVGALMELENRDLYAGIERVSGTSAGAIVAAMVAVGYSPEEVEELMHIMDFKKFKKGWNILRIFTKYGLYSGKYILDFTHDFISNAPVDLPPDATFKDLKEANGKDLYVFAADLNTHSIQEFSFDETPHCVIAEAVRASMSIPLFFKAWQFSNGYPNDHMYVDGGLVYNYPLSFFDKEVFHDYDLGINGDTLGMYLESQWLYNKNAKSRKRTRKKDRVDNEDFNSFKRFKLYNNQFFKYLNNGFHTLLNAQGVDYLEDNHIVRRTIFIDDYGISATNFNLDKSQKELLVKSGKEGAINYFEFVNSRDRKRKKKEKDSVD